MTCQAYGKRVTGNYKPCGATFQQDIRNFIWAFQLFHCFFHSCKGNLTVDIITFCNSVWFSNTAIIPLSYVNTLAKSSLNVSAYYFYQASKPPQFETLCQAYFWHSYKSYLCYLFWSILILWLQQRSSYTLLFCIHIQERRHHRSWGTRPPHLRELLKNL